MVLVLLISSVCKLQRVQPSGGLTMPSRLRSWLWLRSLGRVTGKCLDRNDVRMTCPATPATFESQGQMRIQELDPCTQLLLEHKGKLSALTQMLQQL